MQAIPSEEEPRSGATLTQQVEQNHSVRNIASGDTAARGAGPGSAYLFDGARLLPWGCSRLPGLVCEPDGAATGTRVLALATRTSDNIPTAVSWALRTRDCMGAPAAPAAPAAAASLSGSTPAGVAADDLWSPEDWDNTMGRGDLTEGSAVPPTAGGVLTNATTVGSSNPAADYCSRHQDRIQPPAAASITPAAAGHAGGTLSRLTLLAPHAEGAHHKQQHLQQNQGLLQLQRGPAVLVHVPLKRLRLHPLSAAAADPSSLEQQQQQEEDEQRTAGQAGLLPPLPLLRLYPMGHGPIVYNAEAKTTAPAAARGGCMAATAGARCSMRSSTLAGGCGGSGNSGSPAAVQPAVVSRDANGRCAACSSGPDAAVEEGGAVLVPAGSRAAASSSSTQKRVRLEEGEQEAEQKLCTGGDGGSPNQVQQQVVTTTLLGANGNSCWCCHHRPCCCVWTEDTTEDSSCWGSRSSRSSSGGSGGGA